LAGPAHLDPQSYPQILGMKKACQNGNRSMPPTRQSGLLSSYDYRRIGGSADRRLEIYNGFTTVIIKRKLSDKNFLYWLKISF
jgi:hypothetical protein